MTSYPAGWFPDPVGRFDYRYFDGTTWTADVASAGQRYRDPLTDLRANKLPRTFAIAAFVIGIVSLVASTLPIIALVVPVSAVLGCIFAIVALRRNRRGTGRGKGYAIWGLCISLVAAPASILGITVSTPAFIDAFRLALSPEPPEVTIPVCATRHGSPYAEVVVRNLGTDSRAYHVVVVFAENLGGTDTTVAEVGIDTATVQPGASRRYKATAVVDLRHELLCSYRTAVGFTPN